MHDMTFLLNCNLCLSESYPIFPFIQYCVHLRLSIPNFQEKYNFISVHGTIAPGIISKSENHFKHRVDQMADWNLILSGKYDRHFIKGKVYKNQFSYINI